MSDTTTTPTTELAFAGEHTLLAGNSITLTVTPNNDGPAQDDVVTPHDGDTGGTFSPATATIPAGSKEPITFVYTPPISASGTSVSVVLNDTLSLAPAGGFDIVVQNNPALSVSMVLSNPTGHVGSPTTITLTPGAAPASAVTVSLTDGNMNGTFASASVVLPAGKTDSVTTTYTPTQTGATTIAMTNDAHYANSEPVILDVKAAVSTKITLSAKASSEAGEIVPVTIAVDNGGPISDDVVTLSDGDAGGMFDPATITLSADHNDAMTSNYLPSEASAGKSVTISAKDTLGLDVTSTVEVAITDNSSTELTLSAPSSVVVGKSVTLTITPNNAGPTKDTIVTLSDADGAGTFAPATVTIPKGSNAAVTSVYTPNAAMEGASVVLSATNDGGLSIKNQLTLFVNAATPAATIPPYDMKKEVDYVVKQEAIDITKTPDYIQLSTLLDTYKTALSSPDANGNIADADKQIAATALYRLTQLVCRLGLDWAFDMLYQFHVDNQNGVCLETRFNPGAPLLDFNQNRYVGTVYSVFRDLVVKQPLPFDNGSILGITKCPNLLNYIRIKSASVA